MVATDEAVDWAQGLDGLVERIAPRFRRVEPRRRMRAYLEGLLCVEGGPNSGHSAAAEGRLPSTDSPKAKIV